jgi:hypothetical protein
VGDDLAAKATEIARLQEPGLLLGVAAGALLGLLWALVWMLLARGLATQLGEPQPVRREAGSIADAGSG